MKVGFYCSNVLFSTLIHNFWVEHGDFENQICYFLFYWCQNINLFTRLTKRRKYNGSTAVLPNNSEFTTSAYKSWKRPSKLYKLDLSLWLFCSTKVVLTGTISFLKKSLLFSNLTIKFTNSLSFLFFIFSVSEAVY